MGKLEESIVGRRSSQDRDPETGQNVGEVAEGEF